MTSELYITTVSSIRYMTYEFFVERPMQMVELILKMRIVENPHLRNALDRSDNHPLVTKQSYIPFLSL